MSPTQSPFLCRTFVAATPIDLHPGFKPEQLIKNEHGVYISLDTTVLQVIQMLWSTLPVNLRTQRARYNVKSVFSLDDRDRPGSVVYKARNLVEFTQTEVLKGDFEPDSSKSLAEYNFRHHDMLYIAVMLPPSAAPSAVPSAPLFSIRGSATRPDAASNANSLGGAGAPQGGQSWIEARKEQSAANNNPRRNDQRGSMNGGGRGRAPPAKERYFETRERSRSPRREGPRGGRRPSPSY